MIKFDFTNMLDTAVKNGIDKKDLLSSEVYSAFDLVQSNRGKGMQEWMDLPENQDQVVQDILDTAREVQSNFDYFVVLGIGGSALGSIAVFNALCHLYHNDLPKVARGNAPKFYVLDNADPERMRALFDCIDLKKTMFNCITKSGATSETMSQYLIVTNLLKQCLGEDYNKHIIATTSANKGNLIKLAREHSYKTFYIPEGVGGRFSVFSPVGLLPFAVLNIDIVSLLKGASEMNKICSSRNLLTNPALMSAVIQKKAIDKGCNISVLMPYADKLKYIADWFCQLWAESIGKAVDKSGKVVNVGQTPVKSLGVTDQHSQVQLYAEGPYDKVVVFLECGFDTVYKIPEEKTEFDDVNFLCGQTLNQLMDSEMRATRYALTKANRLNYTITMPCVNAYYLGQLMQMFMLQTAYMGAIYNIDTYNQPGVEGGKNATYALFGRSGYQELAKELSVIPDEQFII